MKKEVGSGVGSGSGSISHRFGSGYPDADPHQKVKDPPALIKSYMQYSPLGIPRTKS
jgi:hypothetical protein